jgi:hypothetical protein
MVIDTRLPFTLRDLVAIEFPPVSLCLAVGCGGADGGVALAFSESGVRLQADLGADIGQFTPIGADAQDHSNSKIPVARRA